VDLAALRNEVPANFRRGARKTWHQRRRCAAVLGMLNGLPRGTALDYGCGYGDLAWAISKNHQTCGVDLDPKRVAFARHEYSPLQFDVCTTDDVPHPDASFDLVTSIVVLNFIEDAAGHLRTVHRILKPGGHLLLACKNVSVVRNFFRSLLGRGPVPARLWMRPRPEVRQLLRTHGFEIQRESYFYDPPFSACKNPADFAFGTIEQFFSAAQISGPAGYFLMLAKKSEIAPAKEA
jgi:ubiquinone/menaquinone biosynthesis C-methylase UbiE